MIRLFIVDDEMIIRQGLRYAIAWEENGVVVCGDAVNGRAALRSLPDCRPDVIITDIQMPQMDGFSFFDKLREMLPRVKVIVLTGYGSPEYMLAAIRSGAFDYLEKPADSQAILRAVLRAKEQIEAEREDARRAADAEQLLSATANLTRAWLIQNILTGGLLEDYARRLGRMLGVPLDDQTRYPFLLIKPVESEIWPLLTALSTAFHTGLIRHMASLDLVGGFLPAGLSRQALRERLEGVPGLPGMCAGPVLVAEDILPLRDGQDLLNRASRETERFYLYEPGALLFLDDLSDAPDPPALDHAAFLEHLDRIASLLDSGRPDAAELACDEALSLILASEPESGQFYALAQMLLLTAAHAMRRDDLAHSLMDHVSGRPSGQALRGRLRALLRNEYAPEPLSNPIIEKALTHMKKRFAEPLSVAGVASMLYLSPAYFGRLFKKVTNMSFNGCLTGLRIEEAKRLLRETDLKNYEIAAATGFSSYKLFALQFQRSVGKSAGEYRLAQRCLGAMEENSDRREARDFCSPLGAGREA